MVSIYQELITSIELNLIRKVFLEIFRIVYYSLNKLLNLSIITVGPIYLIK